MTSFGVFSLTSTKDVWRIPPLTSGAEDARPSLDYVLQGSEMHSKCTRWKEREVSERDRGRRGGKAERERDNRN